jgi:hypothetical protein
VIFEAFCLLWWL